MSALQDVVTKSKRASRQDGGQDRVPALWRATVSEVHSGGVWCIIPRLSGTDPVGPLPSAVPVLAVGDNVVVAAIEGRVDDLLVLASV